MTNPSALKFPSIGLLTLSAIADDPRVRRQGDAFAAAGWDVVGVGVAGAVSCPPSWLIDDRTPALDWSQSARARGSGAEVSSMGRAWARHKADFQYLVNLQAARLSLRAAEKAYWTQNARYRALYAFASQYKPQIWLANDWTVLPIALQLMKEQGGLLVYDTHELASDEYSERLLWHVVHRPLVVALERQGLERASFVTCVSDGIADRLKAVYRLKERPMVICNMPDYQPMPFRPTGSQIEVLYHGVVSPGRGLEECVRSVPLWRPEFRLTIRGPSSDAYRAELERIIVSIGVRHRIRIAPPVPMTDLISEANASDVGLFALPGHSRHNRFALPNKFFEYTMAGLALCVSDLPEMARFLRHYELGTLISGLSPEAIATQINALDHGMIDRYKRNALAAARQLNWEKESEKLLARCSALVTGLS